MVEPKNVGDIGDVFRRFGVGGDIDADSQSGTGERAMIGGVAEDAPDALPLEQPFDAPAVLNVAQDLQPPPTNQEKPWSALPNIESADNLKAVLTGVNHLEQTVGAIADSSAKAAIEIREMHKLYHNEFANRLKSMQDELERYREVDKGRAFDDILREVAKLYSENESIIESISDEKVKKRVRYLLMDLLQILEMHGVCKQRSNPGEKRNTRHCQIIERIPTNDPALHDTVAQSRSAGFYVENRSLVKEFVDIYLLGEMCADELADE